MVGGVGCCVEGVDGNVGLGVEKEGGRDFFLSRSRIGWGTLCLILIEKASLPDAVESKRLGRDGLSGYTNARTL